MPALIERHKMSLAMWAALKTHIMKQREKKKQEQEADAAVERLRREQEFKRKQNAMTLEEIRDQLAQLDKKLQDLRSEKHNMFLYLKKVINEDDKRKNEDKEPSELLQISHPYSNPNVSLPAPNLYMIGNSLVNQNAVMYKVANAPPQQNGTLKRARSPSPPNTTYSQGYGFKTHVTAYGQNYPIPHPTSQFSAQDQAKHLATAYHVPPHIQQQGYVSSIPQQMEHPVSKSSNLQDEKFYIQQTGGISTGYPIRNQPQPTSRFQPPTSHGVTASLQVPLRKEDMMRRNMGNEAHR